MRFICTFGLMVALMMAIATGSASSQEKKVDGKVEQRPTTKILTLPPAYENQMLRLAEILGSLHYLRELCNANEGQTWRDEMQAMIKAEQPVEQRKALLIAHFNRGFRGYREIYRECTLAAAEASNQYLKQGVRLASEIPSRFGR